MVYFRVNQASPTLPFLAMHAWNIMQGRKNKHLLQALEGNTASKVQPEFPCSQVPLLPPASKKEIGIVVLWIFLDDVFDDGSSNNMGVDATLSYKSHIGLEKLQFIESCAPQTFVLFCKFANKEKSSQMSKLNGMCLCYYKWLVGHIVHI